MLKVKDDKLFGVLVEVIQEFFEWSGDFLAEKSVDEVKVLLWGIEGDSEVEISVENLIN